MPSRRNFLLSAAAATVAAATAEAQHTTPDSNDLPPAIAALTSRRPEAVPITLAEREHRLERARQLLSIHHIDALVICSGTSLTYFTDFHWASPSASSPGTPPARKPLHRLPIL